MRLAAILLLLATGCNADRCPLDLLTTRERECPWCKQTMTVYRGETTHRCEARDGK